MAAVIIPALIAGAFSVYEGQQNRKQAERDKPPPPPTIPQQPDETGLSNQRQQRYLSATGRDGTILAPMGITGSPLGGTSAAPGSMPAKTTLGG